MCNDSIVCTGYWIDLDFLQAMSGPLGSLPGFWYDPERKKYFPGVAPPSSEPVVADQTLGIRLNEVEAGPSRLARPIDSRIVGRTRATVQSLKR